MAGAFLDSSYPIDYRVVDNVKNISPVQYYTDASLGGLGNGALESGKTDSFSLINGLVAYSRTTPYQLAPDYVLGISKYHLYVDASVTSTAKDQGALLVRNYSSDYVSIVDSTKTTN